MLARKFLCHDFGPHWRHRYPLSPRWDTCRAGPLRLVTLQVWTRPKDLSYRGWSWDRPQSPYFVSTREGSYSTGMTCRYGTFQRPQSRLLARCQLIGVALLPRMRPGNLDIEMMWQFLGWGLPSFFEKVMNSSGFSSPAKLSAFIQLFFN